ncbi:hypothetical protein LTR70_008255 [Exophiala xenobiotica]|uniref:Gag protein n=1 Tax=Lithohypha guttulata TaxID=1690604 RepID=A0ABR0K297_9EURO|nr:hypothetical protein LTR24_007679 [Lithohypha guttulata]KAK5312332.1 hypothetical protein LTR70_008255 [Exophiala xenobiotica]
MATNQTRLLGSSNWIEWMRDLEKAAEDKDYWDLLTGAIQPIKERPAFDDAKYRPRKSVAKPTNTGEARQGSTGVPTTPPPPPRKPRDQGAAGADDTSTNEFTADVDYSQDAATGLARVHDDLKQWEDGQKKTKAARKLIENSISPVIQGLLRDEDDPVKCAILLSKRYKVDDSTARRGLMSLINNTTLASMKYDTEAYIGKFQLAQADLRRFNKNLSDAELCEAMILGLPPSYEHFLDQYRWSMRDMGKAGEYDMVVLIEELIREGKKRDKPKSNRGNGKYQDTDKSREYKTRENKSGRAPNPDANIVCTHCNKKGHREARCWSKHPEQMPKALKATGKGHPKKPEVKSEKCSGFTAEAGSLVTTTTAPSASAPSARARNTTFALLDSSTISSMTTTDAMIWIGY